MSISWLYFLLIVNKSRTFHGKPKSIQSESYVLFKTLFILQKVLRGMTLDSWISVCKVFQAEDVPELKATSWDKIKIICRPEASSEKTFKCS